MRKTILSLLTMGFALACNAQTYVITRTLGTYFAVGNDGNGGPATAATCGGPWDVCTDTAGNVYVLAQGFSGLRKIDASGIIDVYAGTGSAGYSGNGGPATSAQFATSSGSVAADRMGNVYISEHWGHTIRRIDASGIVHHVAGTYGTSGYSGDGGAASAALISLPSKITVDDAGNVYFMDAGNKRVRKIDVSGIITTVAGNGTNTVAADGLPATATGLDGWSSLAADNQGNLYIGLVSQGRILKVNTTGTFTTYAGSTYAHPGPGTPLPRGADGPALDATFFYIGDIAVDNKRNLYVLHGSIVQRIDTTGTITRIAGVYSNTAGYSGDNGLALLATINGSYGIDVNPAGEVYFTELNNQMIRRLHIENYAPSFAEGSSASLATCTPGGTFGLDTLLRVSDADSADTLVWSVIAPATHGTLTATYNGGSNTGVAYPTGLSYIADIAYTGVDSFMVEVFDGLERDTITVRYTVVQPTTGIGGLSVCTGQPSSLLYTASGGIWQTDDTTIATVNTYTGVLMPMITGTANVTYTAYAGCSTTAVITVNQAVAPISGGLTLCHGETSLLSATPSGGTWSSSDTLVATINSSGLLAALYDTLVWTSVSTITYTSAEGCSATAEVTTNGIPAIIVPVGGTTGCEGYYSSLFTASGAGSYGGGTWSSSDTTVAAIGAYDYVSVYVTSYGAGNPTITYTSPAGCAATVTLTFNAVPVISGSNDVCQGATLPLSVNTTGGTWSCYYTYMASISTTGVVTGNNPATEYIMYTDTNGCPDYHMITVHPASGANAGTTSICSNTEGFLYNTTSGGGTWTSGNELVATIDSVYGGISPVATGTVIMTYTELNSCIATTEVTILAAPAAITGPFTVCEGTAGAFSGPLHGGATPGVWSSSDAAVVKVKASAGTYDALTAGTASITYTEGNGCTAEATVTVLALPAAPSVSGATALYVSSSHTLTGTPSGGTWTSENTARATVDTTGLVTGVSTGRVRITYTVTNTCGSAYSLVGYNIAAMRPAGEVRDEMQSYTLYPNPSTGILYVAASKAGKLRMYSIDGREVYTTAIAAGTNTLLLPESLAAGTYICHVTTTTGDVYTTKVTVATN